MRARKPRLADNARSFLDTYTHGLTREDLQRLFTRDTREAYRFFARGIDEKQLAGAAPAQAVVRAGPALLLGLHAPPLSGPPRDLRRGPPALPGRLPRDVPRLRRGRLAHRPRAAHPRSRPAVPPLGAGHREAVHRRPAREPPGPARGRRPALAQERPRDRPRDPVRHAAAGGLRLPRVRGVRPDAGRPTRSAATSTTSCRCPTAASSSRSATWPARGARPRC